MIQFLILEINNDRSISRPSSFLPCPPSGLVSSIYKDRRVTTRRKRQGLFVSPVIIRVLVRIHAHFPLFEHPGLHFWRCSLLGRPSMDMRTVAFVDVAKYVDTRAEIGEASSKITTACEGRGQRQVKYT